jgi:hypothetical protein
MSFAVVILAALAAVLSYRLLEGWSSRSWLPAACRAGGWSVLALLLVNASCPAPVQGGRPLVLLDGSLSMSAAGGRWSEALVLARSIGETRLVGVPEGDTLPSGGRSLLAPALTGAGSAGRPVVLVSDGEVEDADAIPRELLALATVRILERRAVNDVAIVRVEGATRVTPSDSLRFSVEVESFGAAVARTIRVSAREGDRVWLRGEVELDVSGRGRAVLQGPVPAVPPGAHVLTIALAETGDAEPRSDARLVVVTVVPTPGVVLLASPPTWESRFLLDALRDVAALPVRGYLESEEGQWRSAGALRPVPRDEVAAAARRADLLVTLGAPGTVTAGSRARGRLVLPAVVPGSSAPGDWYVSVPTGTPLASGFGALAVDSFPPGTALAELAAGPRDWIGLTAQAGRRGTVRPVLVGRDSAGTRRIVVGMAGLWRWAFRGGSSEQGYRGLVAASVSWLLGGADSAVGRARLVREVVEQGRPASFEWIAGGATEPVPIEFSGGAGPRRDTLVFDGAGRAELLLPPGIWRYRLSGGGEGTLAVEEFSGELLPRARTLAAHEASSAPAESRIPVRRWLWLFGLGVLAFSGEWLARRRMGLR